MALLMNTNGNARKLMMATNESTTFTEKATDVKRQPNPNVTSAKAAKMPSKFNTPNPAPNCKPLGSNIATMNVMTAMNMAFTKFCSAPEKNIDALDIGEVIVS